MKTYTIPEYGITVTVENHKSGIIVSNLKKNLIGDTGPDPELEGMVDALEALILGHACAGIDVGTPKYIEGLRSALDAIANNV